MTKTAIDEMVRSDLLRSRYDLAGVETALQRISRRLERRMRRTFTIELAMIDIIDNYDGLNRDFQMFFPELRSHVDEWLRTSLNPDISPPVPLRLGEGSESLGG